MLISYLIIGTWETSEKRKFVWQDNLFWILFGTYFVGWLIASISFFRKNETHAKFGLNLFILATCFHFFYLVSLVFGSKEFLFTSFPFIFAIFSFLTIIIFYLLLNYIQNQSLSLVFPPFVILLLTLSRWIKTDPIIPEILFRKYPILGETIFLIHVVSLMSGYIFFLMSSTFAVFFLYFERKIKNKTLSLLESKMPSLYGLDQLTYKTILIGFILFTLGLIIGITMGIIKRPSETFPFLDLRVALSFITWGIYGLFILDRSIKGIRGKMTSLWSILGFCAAVGTFWIGYFNANLLNLI